MWFEIHTFTIMDHDDMCVVLHFPLNTVCFVFCFFFVKQKLICCVFSVGKFEVKS
jgi:hypothetical protein